MKKILVAILGVLFAAPSFAQYSSGDFSLSESSVYYGIRLGMNVANLTGDAPDLGAKVGLNFGGTVGLRLSDTTPIFLESGLYYTGCGASKNKTTISLNYLELPILIKYGIQATDDIAVLPFIGPYFALGLAGQREYQDQKSGDKQKESVYDKLANRNDMGFKLGCGVEYNMLYLELAYQFGIANIADNDNNTMHANQLSINFGVNF